ncbi:MAG: alpha-xylosidase [Spirochaetaceae bacterium]|jgi:alpha-D-xyloside xylohydrolase|nr:alpha-xylosidase [Spirochaetaceae bacterium]
MKFRDGYWEIRKGFSRINLVDVVDTETGRDSFTVYATDRKLPHERIVSIPLITAEFSSAGEDVIRVTMYHHRGAVERGPGFELALPASGAHIEEDEAAVTLRSGGLSLVSSKQSWDVSLFRGGKKLTGISGRNSAYYTGADGECFMVQYLDLSVGETIYGLGERFTAFVKNGQTVDIWNEDGGTASEQAYKNIPFYLSSRGYGVLVNEPGRVSFEVASEVVSAVQFSVPGEIISYYIIAGDTLKDVLRKYTGITGRPALPPAWSFGLWLSTSFTTGYDEETVTSFIDGMAERKIPLSVFHFDCFWMRECRWVDFEWDREQFPDPEGMLTRLHKKGLKICLWINPYVAQKSPLFAEGMAKGYLVKKASGDVWQWDRWQAGMGLVDFTNPAATAWYRGKLKALLDMGVDCFKTDFGERIPTDVVWYNGADPQKMHNYYAFLYNRAVFTLLEETKGRGEAVVFARSAAVGGQRFPVHWGGDCAATYESMAETLRGGLSLGLTGFGFWSHDISGFEQTATPDLFKRWVAFGLLSSHSRLHGNQSYRVPWNFDDEASEVLCFFVKLKCRLMPYLYAAALEAHKEGIPMLRAMILEFPEDPACAYLDRQYMLGPSFLVAPVFSPDSIVSWYLPAPADGQQLPSRDDPWTNYITGDTARGGSWYREQYGYTEIPLMVKPNSIICTGDNDERPDYDYAAGVTAEIFALDNGKSARTLIYDTSGEQEAEISASRCGNVYTIERRVTKAGAGRKPWKALLRGRHEKNAVAPQDGGTVAILDIPAGLLVTPEPDADSVRVDVSD